MEKVTVAYSVDNGGDGSAYPSWWECEEDAKINQESALAGWGESCTGRVETYVGSNIHSEAVDQSDEVYCGHCFTEMDINTWRTRRGICKKCKGDVNG